MQFDVVTLFPGMIQEISQYGILGRAIEKNICSLKCWNPRDYTSDLHRSVDDRPYGGGPGMVMMAQPLARTIQAVRQSHAIRTKVIYLSPQGKRINQTDLQQQDGECGLVFVCGRYEGIDERLIEFEIDEQWSIGDYVLAGGELPALVCIESLVRLLPGALGNEDSSGQDSFSDGLLDFGHYTRPQDYQGRQVPDVLLSGHHGEIAKWRLKQSLGRTLESRPDLLERRKLTQQEQILLDEYKQDKRRALK